MRTTAVGSTRTPSLAKVEYAVAASSGEISLAPSAIAGVSSAGRQPSVRL
jgi:hypothetical protein